MNRARNRFFGFLAIVGLLCVLSFHSIQDANAQTCTTRVTENVIHSARGPKIMVTEHRTCGFETTTRYYYEDLANGYTNSYRSHSGYRSSRYDRIYHHNDRRRHYPHFELRLRGDRWDMYYRGRP